MRELIYMFKRQEPMLKSEKIYQINGQDIKKMFIESAKYIKEHEKRINKINVFPVPDGDTGTNLYFTLSSVSEEIKNESTRKAGKMLEIIATSSLMNSRGNSGIIISQFFNGMYEKTKAKEKLTTKEFIEALKEGEKYAYQAISTPKEGTVLSVIKGSVSRVKQLIKEKKDIKCILKEIWRGALESLKKTKEQMDLLKKSNVIDAGGLGFLYIIEGWMSAFGLSPEHIEINESPNKVSIEIKNRYCTEFLLKGHSTVGKIIYELRKIGDSIEVGKISGYIKVHVHTNHPDLAQKICMEYGIVEMIKVDDMNVLHEHMLFSPVND